MKNRPPITDNDDSARLVSFLPWLSAPSSCASCSGTLSPTPSAPSRSSQNCGYVFATHSRPPTASEPSASLQPSTANDMATRWSSCVAIVTGRGNVRSDGDPVIDSPSDCSEHVMPHRLSSERKVSGRAEWRRPACGHDAKAVALFGALVGDAADARGALGDGHEHGGRHERVRHIGHILQIMSIARRHHRTMSTAASSAGPMTVVWDAVCVTVQPIIDSSCQPVRIFVKILFLLRTRQNWASPWTLALPTPLTVTRPAVMAATASGYVADDASHSTANSAGFR